MQLATVDRSKEWTVDDYLNLGEESWYQLINGELIMSPSPSLNHQLVVGNLYRTLSTFGLQAECLPVLSPIDVYFDEKNIFQPDLVLISNDRKSILSDRGLEGAPDLVVEVLFISNSKYDRYEKKDKYHEFGVLEYWIVDPLMQSVEVFDLQKDSSKPAIYEITGGTFESIHFKGLHVDLSLVFDTATS